MKHLTQLEQAVLDTLLEGGHPALDPLRAQAAGSSVRHREYTGVGFWTNFAVAEDTPAAVPRDVHLSGVGARIAGLEHGAGFLLHVRNGYLDQLEGFTYDEPWPADVTAFELIDTRFQFGRPPSPAPGRLIVSIGDVHGKQELLEALVDGLHLPDSFGWNWDALEDNLRDLNWLPHREVVIYHDAMPDLPPNDLSSYLAVLSQAVGFWEVEQFRRTERPSKLTVRLAPALSPQVGGDTVTGR